MKKKFEVFIEGRHYGGTEIYISEIVGDQVTARMLPAVLKPVTEADRDTAWEPSIILPYRDKSFLQSLVDQAWDLGIRPRYARETTFEVNAIKYHLEDMRNLIFKNKENV